MDDAARGASPVRPRFRTGSPPCPDRAATATTVAAGADPAAPGASVRVAPAPRAATCAPPPWPCSPRSRATATRSCRRSRSAAAASGARARARSTRRCQQLEDEGLSATEERAGRTFALTDEGRAYVEEHKDELSEPWAAVSGGFPKEVLELRDKIAETGAAAWQVLKAGDAEQREKASELLDQTRKALYRLLAADDER